MRKENRVKIKLATVILLLTIGSAAYGATANGLPFMNDNFAKALAEAKQRQVPIFVEVWAPW